MSDSDDANLPCAEECDRRSHEFASLTGTDSALAMFYLQDRDWDLQRSLNDYFEEHGRGGPEASKPGESATQEKTEDPEPHRIRLLSWNIDGLDSGNLITRARAVCDTIKKENPDVVFLQEVVPQTLEVLEEKCPQYLALPGGDEGYFTAMMLKCTSVTMSTSKITPFYSSVMARNLLAAQVKVKGIPMHLMTSHLESTASHVEERTKQLKIALDQMKAAGSDRTVVFGGDLNLRDKDLAKIGGLPENIYDLWEITGKRPEAKFTWDLRRNDNLAWEQKWKPQCRFDRLYIRHSEEKQLKPVYFELVGIERIQSCRRFPSDHWGILAHFDIIKRLPVK